MTGGKKNQTKDETSTAHILTPIRKYLQKNVIETSHKKNEKKNYFIYICQTKLYRSYYSLLH